MALSLDHLKTIHLIAVEGKSDAEAAEVLDVSERTIERRWSEAKVYAPKLRRRRPPPKPRTVALTDGLLATTAA
ncbi:MAG: ECF-type sigma factor [Planctomycetota bacterium]